MAKKKSEGVLSAATRVRNTNARSADSSDRESVPMGLIASTYDLMAEGTEVDLQAVIDMLPGKLPAGVELKQTSIKEVAFGLKKVEAFVVIDDSDEGIGDKLESVLRSLPGIGEVQNVDSTVL